MSTLNTMLVLILTILLSFTARAQQTLFPAAIPLAVRSPYLTSWDFVRNGSIFGQLWPRTFDSKQVCSNSGDRSILIFLCLRFSDGLSSYVLTVRPIRSWEIQSRPSSMVPSTRQVSSSHPRAPWSPHKLRKCKSTLPSSIRSRFVSAFLLP